MREEHVHGLCSMAARCAVRRARKPFTVVVSVSTYVSSRKGERTMRDICYCCVCSTAGSSAISTLPPGPSLARVPACLQRAQQLLGVQVEVAVQDGDYALASPYLSDAFSIIDKNVKRNLLHKNTASRKKSKLAHKVKALEPTS